MHEFLEVAHNARNLAVPYDFSQIKSFLEKNGSNRVLKEKKLDLFRTRPFDILLKYKDFEGVGVSENKMGLTDKNTVSPVIWKHLGIVSNKVTEDFLRLEAFIKNHNR